MLFFNLRTKVELFILSQVTRISPVINTRYWYWRRFHKKLDLENPQTSNEKILWLKLNTYRDNPLVEMCADKCSVRDYVRKCGYEDILIKTYGIYDDVNQIPWEQLPNKFVIKSNYGCALNFICEDKSKLDIKEVQKELSNWKKDMQHLRYSEMQYSKMKRRYLCEQYLDTNTGCSLDDFKVYCCNGKPTYVMVCVGRSNIEDPKFYYFDSNGAFKREFSQDGLNAPENFIYNIPEGWDKMINCAENLSKPFPFVRCDFYILSGKVYFGELTFTPCAGLDKDKLYIVDKLIGEQIKL